ncbi:hypothetical protein SISSUDRAFT_1089833 [Sistotremastrum suecicum HHB10207 ss-3]|uniref:Uncharacterized protein n=1 Tax=Sistotremastrum suecicum HHB10207 ss-3 TaxID=1314776 RepID=A0A165YGB6_9AGAM|nr:hypothetical protein SISSUDRAFT_1089833 [Sistotremastrum suecicum HHB10207 ss-3]
MAEDKLLTLSRWIMNRSKENLDQEARNPCAMIELDGGKMGKVKGELVLLYSRELYRSQRNGRPDVFLDKVLASERIHDLRNDEQEDQERRQKDIRTWNEEGGPQRSGRASEWSDRVFGSARSPRSREIDGKIDRSIAGGISPMVPAILFRDLVRFGPALTIDRSRLEL